VGSRPPIATPPADEGRTRPPRSRRTWLGRVVPAGAFALLLVALGATAAAASEPLATLGTLVDEVSAPVVEPVVELAGSTGSPIIEPIVPDAPVLPTLPIAPILPLPPVLSVPPVLESPVELAIHEIPDPVADTLVTSVSTAAAPRVPAPILETSPIDEVAAGSVATIGADVAKAATAVAQELVQSLQAAISVIGLTGDASTSVMAGMLIGLSMAMAAGWSLHAGQVRLRPIGLQLAPPVPPG